MLAVIIVSKNGTATAQDIDIAVEGRVAAGNWTTLLNTLTDVIGLPNVDKATSGEVLLADATALVTEAATYEFRCQITLSAAATVRFTTQYILIITYRMG